MTNWKPNFSLREQSGKPAHVESASPFLLDALHVLVGSLIWLVG